MENLAIIPARGGSKRIPRKNIIDFFGKPIISYSIATAKKFKGFSEIMVSTDDEEIADIAKRYGAEVPFMRSSKNSDHYAGLKDVVEEVIATYRKSGKSFDTVCCILPTAPLLTVNNLQRGYELLLSRKYNSVRPVVRFSYPIQRAYTMKNGMVEFIHPENVMVRSQDLEDTYHDAGQFYWMYFDRGWSGEKRGGFEISELEVQDIDTAEDLKIAELKYRALNSR